jgi:hypothetical protein
MLLVTGLASFRGYFADAYKEHDPVANSASAFVDQALSGFMEAGKRAFAHESWDWLMLIRWIHQTQTASPQVHP